MSKGSTNVVGRTITRFRDRLKITRAQLARRMDRTRAVICRWEAGVYTPPMDAIFDLTKALETTPALFADELENEYRRRLRRRTSGKSLT